MSKLVKVKNKLYLFPMNIENFVKFICREYDFEDVKGHNTIDATFALKKYNGKYIYFNISKFNFKYDKMGPNIHISWLDTEEFFNFPIVYKDLKKILSLLE